MASSFHSTRKVSRDGERGEPGEARRVSIPLGRFQGGGGWTTPRFARRVSIPLGRFQGRIALGEGAEAASFHSTRKVSRRAIRSVSTSPQAVSIPLGRFQGPLLIGDGLIISLFPFH